MSKFKSTLICLYLPFPLLFEGSCKNGSSILMEFPFGFDARLRFGLVSPLPFGTGLATWPYVDRRCLLAGPTFSFSAGTFGWDELDNATSEDTSSNSCSLCYERKVQRMTIINQNPQSIHFTIITTLFVAFSLWYFLWCLLNEDAEQNVFVHIVHDILIFKWFDLMCCKRLDFFLYFLPQLLHSTSQFILNSLLLYFPRGTPFTDPMLY